ncbi:hypothetical protein ABZ656_35625 [Streptomyces sp. NPDC007095]|jgi:aryl-alcohol dehydrogenase-like predicted oxidoreductase|uniref:hypothetical protein n=1 Tax=Streptomyces sp. NPDC007095 TaxID=3154482 RepID=UPI00268EE427
MRTTTLGSKGPEAGVIGLGCMGMTFSYDMKSPRDEATSVAVVLPQVSASLDRGTPMPLDLGATLIDTADV